MIKGVSIKKALLLCGIAGMLGMAGHSAVYASEGTGFYLSSDGKYTYYKDEKGKQAINEIKEIDHRLYYFDETGALLMDENIAIDLVGYRADEYGVLRKKPGWLETADGWYYSADDGSLYHDMVLYSGEKHYYLGSDGKVQTNLIVEDEGKLYYAGEDGIFREEEGWVTDGKNWYYVGSDGSLSHDVIIESDGYLYYLNNDGVMVRGALIELDGKYYLVQKNGTLRVKAGWIWYQGWYYMRKGPELVTNDFVVDDKTYYMWEDGKLFAGGFFTHEGKSYYAMKNGTVQTKKGWKKIGTDWYYFRDGGALATDEVLRLDGHDYYFEPSGRLAVNTNVATGDGRAFTADKNGVLSPRKGWFEADGKWYLAESDGKLHRGEFVTRDKAQYYFHDDCSMAENEFFHVNSKMYYATGSGKVRSRKGWMKLGQNWYYSDAKGVFYRSVTLKIDGEEYYFDAQGAWTEKGSYVYYTGIVEDTSYTTIDGRRYHVNDDGEIDSWFGIDVSAWNGDIDWEKVAADGVDFAIVRVGGRFIMSTGIYDDSKAEENILGAAAAGIPVGVYFYTGATTVEEAIEEADFVLEKIRGLPVDLPVVMDTEYSEGGRHSLIDRQTRTDVIKAFCQRIEEGGYRAMYYAGMAWCESHVDTEQLDYMHWCAQWWIRNQCDDLGIPYQVWQYTDVGSIDGIKGNVDCNIWYRHQTVEAD
ncbi:MAG: hypothetical protein IKN79_08845 [Eubacterium sp.]|nr:hypothetical protein [Eubacterium sp.]